MAVVTLLVRMVAVRAAISVARAVTSHAVRAVSLPVRVAISVARAVSSVVRVAISHAARAVSHLAKVATSVVRTVILSVKAVSSPVMVLMDSSVVPLAPAQPTTIPMPSTA